MAEANKSTLSPESPDDILYQSDRTLVFRRTLEDGRSLILKQPLGTNARDRLLHEKRILSRLKGISGVSQMASDVDPVNAIAFEDTQAISLASLVDGESLDNDWLLKFALDLSRILADVHRSGVLHKDISPANVLIDPASLQVTLIDFDLATTFNERNQDFVQSRKLAGTLAYLAPEQTGRTGRVVDQRTDLYSLGTLLYELATDTTPFRGDNALEVVHDILAKTPTPAADLNGAIPRLFSDIIMRLLNKEPNQRYQSAKGLAYDLSLLISRYATARAGETVDGFELGQRDFPQQLMVLTRMIGNENELAALNKSFRQAIRDGYSVLVSGEMGVGKTTLINELRNTATTRNGWFVSGAFDQFSKDEKGNAIFQIIRDVFRMMLALPEAEHKRRVSALREKLGNVAGILASTFPDVTRLLKVTPGDVSASSPQFAQMLTQAALEVFRVNTSQGNPLVLVLENLQWANVQQLTFIEFLLTSKVPGLLVVGSYREKEGLDNPYLVAMLERLQVAPSLAHVQLQNLPLAQLEQVVTELLGLSDKKSKELTALLMEHTLGNPYETLSFIGSLKHFGVIEVSEEGWCWDEKKLRQFVSQGAAKELLAARIDALPEETRELLGYICSLGNKCQLDLLATATGKKKSDIELELLPVLEDGILIAEDQFPSSQDGVVYFQNNRAEQVAYQRFDKATRQGLHWEIARRLDNRPEFRAQAAEQYLSAVDMVTENEVDRVVEVFKAAANHALNGAYYIGVERFLKPAIALLKKFKPEDRESLLQLMDRLLHAFNLMGNHSEVDAIYRDFLEVCGDDPLLRVDAACVQISSLSNRQKIEEAAAMALELLSQLGLQVPDELDAFVSQGLDQAVSEFRNISSDESPGKVLSEPTLIAQAKLLETFIFVAFVHNPSLYAWAALESKRLWVEYGAHSALMSGVGTLAVVLISAKEEYLIAQRIYQWLVKEGDAHGYKVDAARNRGFKAVFTDHWARPLEDSLQEVSEAMSVLLQAGDVQDASYISISKIYALVDCGKTIEEILNEIEDDLELSNRIDSDYAVSNQIPARQFLKSLCNETDSAGVFTDSSFNKESFLKQTKNPIGLTCLHVYRAVAAFMFGDHEAFAKHTDFAEKLLPAISGVYIRALVYVIRAIALTQKIKAGDPEKDQLIEELHECYQWLEQRANDSTANFSHLVLWVSAETAWALGKEQEAIQAFDRAMTAVSEQTRPWHRALITERAGELYLELGLIHTAQVLLGEARRLYDIWGASGKVRALAEKYPFLKVSTGLLRNDEESSRSRGTATTIGTGSSSRDSSISEDGIDLLGILQASQALSSETSLSSLRVRMKELLQNLTGATNITGVFWNQDMHEWQITPEPGDPPVQLIPEIHAERFPFSVLHYIERTGQPLVINNVALDDRFRQDPYFAGVSCCSLMGLPVFNKDKLRIILIFENRLSFGAFSGERLETVQLIAGQLAVSIDNALLYDSLERKVEHRTRALEQANRKLEAISRTDPLTGLANRRHFDEALEAEWRRGTRTKSPLGLVIIDIDDFKKFNDHYGHQGGDACLASVADILSQGIRSDTDLIARYGGEEFVFILPGADANTAGKIAERARSLVEAHRKPHEKSDGGIVTISMGVASLIPAAGESPEILLATADAALYKAKSKGKNQVVKG